MVNYVVATCMPKSYKQKWLTDLHLSMSPVMDSSLQGLDHANIEIDVFRVFKHDEKKFLEKLKTYNNMDHQGGDHRAWHPSINLFARALRRILGLGSVPLTPSHPINTPGHVVILARFEDKKTKEGVEMR